MYLRTSPLGGWIPSQRWELAPGEESASLCSTHNALLYGAGPAKLSSLQTFSGRRVYCKGTPRPDINIGEVALLHNVPAGYGRKTREQVSSHGDQTVLPTRGFGRAAFIGDRLSTGQCSRRLYSTGRR